MHSVKFEGQKMSVALWKMSGEASGTSLLDGLSSAGLEIYLPKSLEEAVQVLSASELDFFLVDVGVYGGTEKLLSILRANTFLKTQVVLLSQAPEKLRAQLPCEYASCILSNPHSALSLLQYLVGHSREGLSFDINFVLDAGGMSVSFFGGFTETLTAIEFQLLSLLLGQSNCSLSRRTIEGAIWPNCKVGSKTLNVHLVHLRKKIRQHGWDVAYQGGNRFALERKPVRQKLEVANHAVGP